MFQNKYTWKQLTNKYDIHNEITKVINSRKHSALYCAYPSYLLDISVSGSNAYDRLQEKPTEVWFGTPQRNRQWRRNRKKQIKPA